MPSKKKQKENQDKVLEVLKNVPVPVPGSAASVLDVVRKHLMSANKKTKKDKKDK